MHCAKLESSFSVGSIGYNLLWQHLLGMLRRDAHFFLLHCVFLISTPDAESALNIYWVFHKPELLAYIKIHFHRPVRSMAVPQPHISIPLFSASMFYCSIQSSRGLKILCFPLNSTALCSVAQAVTCSWDHSNPITEQSCMPAATVDWEHLSQVS